VVPYLEDDVELVECECSGPEATVLDLIVADGSLVLETRGVLNVAPSAAQQTVERNFGVEGFAISELHALGTQLTELGVVQVSDEVHESIGVLEGERQQRRVDNDFTLVAEHNGTHLELVGVSRGGDLLLVDPYAETLLDAAGLDLDLLVSNDDTNQVNIGTSVRPASGEVVGALTLSEVHEARVHLEAGVRHQVEELIGDTVDLEILTLDTNDLRITCTRGA